jgi:hypothetical protein
MTEGWNGDDYLILFAEDEIASASDRYSIVKWLPSLNVIGLRGWDDFILRDAAGQTYSVPTIPATRQHLSPFALPDASVSLTPDAGLSN